MLVWHLSQKTRVRAHTWSRLRVLCIIKTKNLQITPEQAWSWSGRENSLVGRNLEQTQTLAPGHLPLAELRIVLIGKTGSGKSATGNTILGQQVFWEEQSPSSVTTTCRKASGNVRGRSVTVIDTPGIFDTVKTDEEMKREMRRCIMLSIPGPHVFLLVLRLDSRYTGEEMSAVEWIRRHFGGEASRYTLVLFTRGDQVEEPVETYLRRSPGLRELIERVAGYEVFDNTSRVGNRTQVADLLEKVDEVVQRNCSHYTSNLYEEAQRGGEKWHEYGEYMETASNELFKASIVTAAFRNPGVSVFMLAGAGVSKAVSWWMKR